MPVEKDLIPEYVVLVSERERYKLNHKKEMLEAPSEALIAYAKEHGTNISIDVDAFDKFAQNVGLKANERTRRCCYIVLKYNETDEQLQRLIDM